MLVERGPGFYGETSFIERQADGGERAAKVRAHADVTYLPGSRYVLWDTTKLEAVLFKDPALRNALLAQLGSATAKKLFEMTWAVGTANEQGCKLKHRLYDEFYVQEVHDVLWQTFLRVMAAEGGDSLARQPIGVALVLPWLKELQEMRGISDKKLELALREHGIDLQAASERGDSLLALCETVAHAKFEKQGEKHKQLKQALKADKARSRVVGMGTSTKGIGDAHLPSGV